MTNAVICRSCGAKVQWAITEKGRRMPIDWLPVPNGNIQLRQQQAGPPLAVYLKPEHIDALDDLDKRRLFLSHFVTCPQAKRWRRK